MLLNILLFLLLLEQAPSLEAKVSSYNYIISCLFLETARYKGMSSFYKEEGSGLTIFQFNAVETVTGEKGFRAVKANKPVTDEFNVESSRNT